MEPSDDERALWAAIRANPADDLPRLVYADWLEEHGRAERAERAEFIRVQCRLAQLPADRREARQERGQLEGREAELLTAHEAEWLTPVSAVVARANVGVSLARGFRRSTSAA